MKIEYGNDQLAIDLAAERVIAAEKGNAKIAVELKSFAGSSLLYEFHQACGQYRNYWRVLRRLQPDRVLYLAITNDAYDGFQQSDVIRLAIEEDGIKLLTFQPRREAITRWIN